MTAARRLAAILAADVVGYSRLMGEDEAGTAKAVRGGAMPPGRWWPTSAAASSRRPATACCWNFLHRRCRRMRDGSIVHTTHATAAHKRVM